MVQTADTQAAEPQPTRKNLMRFLVERGDDETISRLYILQAAWRLSDRKFELLLEVESGWLTALRNRKVETTASVRQRLCRLYRLQDALCSVVAPLDLADFWRRPRTEPDGVRARSPWIAFEADGPVALDRMQASLERASVVDQGKVATEAVGRCLS
jgi:hypothetical protein